MSRSSTDRPGLLEELADGVLAFTADGDPNVGAVVGDDAVAAIDARATPAAAAPWLRQLRRYTDKPIRYLVLTHYHAVRVLGACAFDAEDVVASEATAELIASRGAEDWESEFRRFPRLAPEPEEVPGLTIPTISFRERATVDLGGRELQLEFVGRGHTAGDTVAWVPDAGVLFAGDLVERGAAPYMGEAYIEEWITGTLDRVAAFGAGALVPGRGPALRGEDVAGGIAETRAFLAATWEHVTDAGRLGLTRAETCRRVRDLLAPRFGEWAIFEHCVPYNVARALDELAGREPCVWTAEADAALAQELRRGE